MSDTEARDFIRQIIHDDLESGKHAEIVTRFPPEPNGYLHVGHVMSICLNFGVTEETAGRTFLRFDDTNPGKEDQAYVDAIESDVRWLGFGWEDRLTHASDYFERLYEAAEQLVEAGLAYVDSLSADEMREYRGTLTEPGKNSPHRDRSIEENLDLFRRMRAGEFADGQHILRAKIDMASPNMNLRDPALYRIRHIAHQHAGDSWCIYPMYDFAHTLSDAFEGITHSLCTLEFRDHRPLYDWFLDQLKPAHRPRQIEFSRLNLAYSITSKRKLNALVEENIVAGWDPSGHGELLRWAELIDTASFPNPTMPVELDEPALQLMTFVEQNRDPARISRFINDLLNTPFETLALADYVRTVLDPALEVHQRDIELMRRRVRVEGDVATYDLSDQPPRAYNKFIAYSLHPEIRYLVGVSRGPDGSHKLSVGYNPWLPAEDRAHDIATLCERLGGGGHPYVGGASFDADAADAAVAAMNETAETLRRGG